MNTRFRTSRARWLWLAAAAVTSLGCGTGAPSTKVAKCAEERRADVYTPGLEKTGLGGRIKARLLDAAPNPPAKGDNVWRLQLTDSAGTPIDGATIVTTPWMPDHEHGTSIKSRTTPVGRNGEYELGPVNLFMPALWEVTMKVTDGQRDDSVVYAFCIEG